MKGFQFECTLSGFKRCKFTSMNWSKENQYYTYFLKIQFKELFSSAHSRQGLITKLAEKLLEIDLEIK